MDKLIYVEYDYDGMYGMFWSELGEVHHDRSQFLDHPDDYGLVCFTGGSDVSPNVYGHSNLQSHNDEERDDREMETFQKARQSDIPMTGICRGSQFLNSMLGGTMVQHLRETHGGGQHNVIAYQDLADKPTDPKNNFEVTSSHHQMSLLADDGVLLSWADKLVPITSLVWDGDREELEMMLKISGNYRDDGSCLVTEAFAYPGDRVFAVQHHPEWQKLDCPAAVWTLNMTRAICFEEDTAEAPARALAAR